jgi:hypothetical protein
MQGDADIGAVERAEEAAANSFKRGELHIHMNGAIPASTIREILFDEGTVLPQGFDSFEGRLGPLGQNEPKRCSRVSGSVLGRSARLTGVAGVSKHLPLVLAQIEARRHVFRKARSTEV